MPEDKLTHKQRVRLESLSQAQGLVRFLDVDPSIIITEVHVFELAETIEKWLWAVENKAN